MQWSIDKEKKERLLAWVKDRYALPLKAVLNITYRCNQNCLFCGDAVNRKKNIIDYKNELPDETWIKLVKECRDIGVKEWWFPGLGEPLMRKDLLLKIIDEIKSAKHSNCVTNMNSNGTLFDLPTLTKFVEKGFDELSFSLESTNPSTHNYLRGLKGSFQKLIWAAKTLKNLKKEYKKDKPVFTVCSVLTQKNYSEFKKLIKLSKDIGAEKINVNPLRIDSGNYPNINKENLRITQKQVQEIKKQLPFIKKYAHNKGIQFDMNSLEDLELFYDIKEDNKIAQGYDLGKKFETYEQKFINSPCHEPWYCISIDPFGNVTPCTSTGNENVISNIKKESIKKIWARKEFKKIRESILNNKPLKVCSKCLIFSVREHSKRIMGSENV